jgi:hypothetical protein
MIEAKPADVDTRTCVSCEKPAVIVLAVKWRNWSTTTALCESCRKAAVKCLSPGMPSKKDLQTVWDMAAEMSGENSYAIFDEETGENLGKSRAILKALNRVKKFFGLRGKDVT